MMAAGGETSIKEITECSICLDTYKNPKGLPCLHTFCCQCLEKFCEDIGGNQQKPACPLCRKAFVIPQGGIRDLPNNFMMNSLMLANPSIRKAEITDKTTFCELCLVMDVNTAAAAYCTECDQHICERHLSSHNNKKQSKSHKILMFDEDDELCESFEKQVRSKVLKENIKKIKISTIESGKKIKLIKDEKSSLIATVEATRKKITKKYNQVLALINSHHILLKDNLDIFEEKKLTEIEQSKDEEETRFQTLESFNSYLVEMENKEIPEDVDANDLYAKTEEFVVLHCLTPLTERNGINMTFVPSHFTADGVENLIGVLSFQESSVWSGGQYQGQGMAGFSYPTTSSMYYPSMPHMPPPPYGPGFGMSQMRASTPRWPKRENVRVDMPTTTTNGSLMRPPRPFGSSSSSGIPPTMLRYPTMSLPMQNPYPTMTPHPYSTMTPPHPYPTITPSQPHPYPTMTPSQRPAFSAMPPPIQNSYPAMIQPVPNSLPATPQHAAQGQHLVMGGILSPPRSRNRFNPATRNSPQVCVPAEPSQSVVVAGQEPLTRSMLSDAPPQEQKQMLGERLFPQINSMYPELAGKITGMLLEIDNGELLHMLDSREALKAKVEEAVAVLQAHQARESV